METTTTNPTLERFNNTPTYVNMNSFEDADDELRPIAEHVKTTTTYNEYIEPSRIKFLYQNKSPGKDGGRYTLFNLVKRTDMDKMINDTYDFILIVFYDVWKDLEGEQKVIQLDKALCGIDMGTEMSPKIGKKSPDSKEFISNMRQFGANRVMEVSEMIHLACERVVEERKEEKKKGREKS